MILTKEGLERLRAPKSVIKAFGQCYDDGEKVTPEVLLNIDDTIPVYHWFATLIPDDRKKAFQDELFAASADCRRTLVATTDIFRSYRRMVLLGHNDMDQRERKLEYNLMALIKDAQAATDKERRRCFEALSNALDGVSCGDSYTKPPPLTKEFVEDSIRATERILDEVFDKNAAGAYPQRDRETIRDALEALRVAILALEDIKDLTKEYNNG